MTNMESNVYIITAIITATNFLVIVIFTIVIIIIIITIIIIGISTILITNYLLFLFLLLLPLLLLQILFVFFMANFLFEIKNKIHTNFFEKTTVETAPQIFSIIPAIIPHGFYLLTDLIFV